MILLLSNYYYYYYCPWHRSEVVLFPAECVCLIIHIWLDCHTVIINRCIQGALGRGCVCMYVCLHDNLKTVAETCFLLGSCIDWRKILDKFASQDHRSRWRSFSEVQGHSIMSQAILPQVARFSFWWIHFPVKHCTLPFVVILQSLLTCHIIITINIHL